MKMKWLLESYDSLAMFNSNNIALRDLPKALSILPTLSFHKEKKGK